MGHQDKYKVFREGDIKNLKPFLLKAEGINLTAQRSLGKSRFLKHLTEHAEFRGKITFVYLDLKLALDTTLKYLLNLVCNGLNIPAEEWALYSKIDKVTTNNKKIYILIDNCDMLDKFDLNAINYLRALRDKYKYILAYVLAHPSDAGLSSKLTTLSEICQIKYELQPLDDENMKKTILDMAKVLNVKAPGNKINQIIKDSHGFPAEAKKLLAELAIPNHVRNKHYIQKILTKNEIIVYELLLSRKGEIITRDEIATILNPKTQGSGVSNMAIDQMLSRIRKKIRTEGYETEIKSKKGIGYFID